MTFLVLPLSATTNSDGTNKLEDAIQLNPPVISSVSEGSEEEIQPSPPLRITRARRTGKQ